MLQEAEARKRIEKEDDLINHRMTWCIGSNSFLLGALMLSSNVGIKNIFGALVKNIIPYAGAMLSLTLLISILAAWSAIWNWRNLCSYTGDKNKNVFSPPKIAFCGSIASITSPVIFLSIWIVLIHAQIFAKTIDVNDKTILAFQNVYNWGLCIIVTIVISSLILWTSHFASKEFYFWHRAKNNNHKLISFFNFTCLLLYSFSYCLTENYGKTICNTICFIGYILSLNHFLNINDDINIPSLNNLKHGYLDTITKYSYLVTAITWIALLYLRTIIIWPEACTDFGYPPH